MSIKMIVTDLDGTLLRKDKSISEYTKKILSKCQRQNIKVVFATARPERTTYPYLDCILPDAIISNNGAKISCKEKELQVFEINAKTVQKIVTQLLDMEMRFCLDYEDFSLTNCLDYQSWKNWNALFSNFKNYDPNGVQKIAVQASDLSQFSDMRLEEYGCSVYANQNDKWYMITDNEASKTAALKYLSIYYDLSLHEIVAFGDDYNDIDMLGSCGVGVAMENSVTEIKKYAQYLCPSNDKDGVAMWIEKNILKNI